MGTEAIIKRDGRIVKFDKRKVTRAIFKAAYKVSGIEIIIEDALLNEIIDRLHTMDMDMTDSDDLQNLIHELNSVVNDYNAEDIELSDLVKIVGMIVIADQLADEVGERLSKTECSIPNVDNVQDAIEKTLIENGHAKTSTEFILYRAERSRVREMNSSLMKTYEDLTFSDASEIEVKRENANIDGDSAMGTMLRYGSEGAKKFNLLYLLSPDIADAHKNGDIHIHDLDFYALTLTCCQIDLEKLFAGGFNTGHGFLREPSEIRSYAALSCIAIQANQNDMHKQIA